MSSLYLYAIIRSTASLPDLPDDVTGVGGTSLHAVTEAPLAAIASPTPDGKLRPRRRNLKAHHDVIKRLAATETVLPMAFGVVAESDDHVRAFLDTHAEPLTGQLAALDGHVEIGFRVRWNVDDIFAHFVEQYDELRSLRDAFFGESGSASRGEMIQLGEQFEALLNAERSAHQSTLESYLAPVCQRIEADDPRNETEAANLACLVARDAVDAFETAVHNAAEEFNDVFTFTYTDPMAPYSFADVEFD